GITDAEPTNALFTMNLGHLIDHLIRLKEIPVVAVQLTGNVTRKAGRSKNLHGAKVRNIDANDAVKPNKVIDMSMSDKNPFDAQDVPCRDLIHLPDIKHDGAARFDELNVEARITVDTVQQAGNIVMLIRDTNSI